MNSIFKLLTSILGLFGAATSLIIYSLYLVFSSFMMLYVMRDLVLLFKREGLLYAYFVEGSWSSFFIFALMLYIAYTSPLIGYYADKKHARPRNLGQKEDSKRA